MNIKAVFAKIVSLSPIYSNFDVNIRMQKKILGKNSMKTYFDFMRKKKPSAFLKLQTNNHHQ